MAESTIVKTKCDGTLTLLDGTGTPLEYEVAFEDGNLTVNIPGRTVQNFKDRNKIGSTPALRFGEDQPMTWSFDAWVRDLSDGTDELLPDFILDPEGDLSTAVGAWVSTLGTNAEVPTRTLRWDIEGTDHGDAADHSMTLPFCTVSGSIDESGEGIRISLEGTSWAVYPSALT